MKREGGAILWSGSKKDEIRDLEIKKRKRELEKGEVELKSFVQINLGEKVGIGNGMKLGPFVLLFGILLIGILLFGCTKQAPSEEIGVSLTEKLTSEEYITQMRDLLTKGNEISEDRSELITEYSDGKITKDFFCNEHRNYFLKCSLLYKDVKSVSPPNSFATFHQYHLESLDYQLKYFEEIEGWCLDNESAHFNRAVEALGKSSEKLRMMSAEYNKTISTPQTNTTTITQTSIINTSKTKQNITGGKQEDRIGLIGKVNQTLTREGTSVKLEIERWGYRGSFTNELKDIQIWFNVLGRVARTEDYYGPSVWNARIYNNKTKLFTFIKSCSEGGDLPSEPGGPTLWDNTFCVKEEALPNDLFGNKNYLIYYQLYCIPESYGCGREEGCNHSIESIEVVLERDCAFVFEFDMPPKYISSMANSTR